MSKSSNKNERVKKLIALHEMISQQKRDSSGNAKFNKEQLSAAELVITEVLAIDKIVKAE